MLRGRHRRAARAGEARRRTRARVDGGSTRMALLGDIPAELSISNGWAGVVVNGAVRDSAEVDAMDQPVFAPGTAPVKSLKNGWGRAGVEFSFGASASRPAAGFAAMRTGSSTVTRT